MHPGRIVGVLMGLLILVGVFGLAFYSNGEGQSATLYSIFTSAYSQLGQIQNQGNTQTITLAYLFIIGSILIIIAGFVGIFPLGTGVLGIVGMALITVGPMLVVPGQTFSLQGYGTGYYVIGVASVIALGASFWHGKGGGAGGGHGGSGTGTVVQNVNVQVGGAPQAPQPMGIVCPSCGTPNAPGAAYCARCSTRLM